MGQAHEPADPHHDLASWHSDLAASWHSYIFSTCNNLPCWRSQIAPVIAKVPVIAGETGQSGCTDTYINPLMAWLDAKSTSDLAWTWDAWQGACSSGPALISSYAGTPTGYGADYRAHLLSLPHG